MRTRTANRSSWASGSGKVPSYSTGFWVAMIMKGWGRARVDPSTVTCPSSMHSSSADWVLGDARLISSTRMTFANTGPGRNKKAPAFWSQTVTPVTSAGSRSAVHCTRE